MKIAVIGPQFPDSFARNVSVTLSHMGHTVSELNGMAAVHNRTRLANGISQLLDKAFPQVERSRYRRLVNDIASLRADLVLVTIATLPPEIVHRIKSVSRCPVVCWYTDPAANLRRFYLLAGNYDALFIKEPFLVRTFRNNLGLNTYYLPEACNPRWHKQAEISDANLREYGCDIAGAGTLHYYRARMFEPFLDYDLKIWGCNAPSWLNSPVRKHYTDRFVAEESKSIAYRSAKVFINTIGILESEGVNCTLFEAAGCGAFQIADWKPVLAEHFVPEQEVVTYRSRGELMEKVKYYLEHPTERDQIAQRGYLRAHREHTYEHRLTAMFQVLGLADRRDTTGVLLAK